jgi:hypothetical protein
MNSPTITSGPPSLEVTFEMAAKESPFLRANLNHFEDELDELTRWVDEVGRSMKAYTDELGRK